MNSPFIIEKYLNTLTPIVGKKYNRMVTAAAHTTHTHTYIQRSTAHIACHPKPYFSFETTTTSKELNEKNIRRRKKERRADETDANISSIIALTSKRVRILVCMYIFIEYWIFNIKPTNMHDPNRYTRSIRARATECRSLLLVRFRTHTHGQHICDMCVYLKEYDGAHNESIRFYLETAAHHFHLFI